jgi:GNAT superfamily N-acetyltransferase
VISLGDALFTISPGWKTDLAILALGGSEIETFDDHLVVRTPTNPEYHWGNCLLVLDPASVDKNEKWVERLRSVFPNNDWIAIGLPLMPSNVAAWEKQGITLEQLDVLSTSSLPTSQPLPYGYTSRHFDERDWETLTRREISYLLAEGGYEPAATEAFAIESNASRRRLCAAGDAAWFGAYREDELVASLGIVTCGTTARYQSVETNEAHRGKGLASHLLGLAASWSQKQGFSSWVIVTEEANAAGRVYRRAGFAPDISEVNAYKKMA